MGARNLEAPFYQADSYLTPTNLFYIRSPFSGTERQHRVRTGCASMAQ